MGLFIYVFGDQSRSSRVWCSTYQFPLGFRRFIAGHGKLIKLSLTMLHNSSLLVADTIGKLWADILTENDVLSYLANANIQCKFIVELAPWMAGLYARMVGLVKMSLRKAIGKILLKMSNF